MLPIIKVDPIHTLENFLNMYDAHADAVVTEAIANSLDANANNIEIVFKDGYISFTDNGPGMTKRRFNSYHNISKSTKTIGKSIGFAGVGAKIYLAASQDTVIHTETCKNGVFLASDMYRKRGTLSWDKVEVEKLDKTGTLYKVNLLKNDFERLRRNAKLLDIIQETFNPALLNGLKITINGVNMEPWRPEHEYVKHGYFKIKTKRIKFPISIYVMNEDIDPKYRKIHYSVYGKNITDKKIESLPDLIAKRLYVTVDAEKNAKYLKTEKNAFRNGVTEVAEMYDSASAYVFKTLREAGYVGKPSDEVEECEALGKKFKQLFNNPRFSWLNPDATAAGTGSGKSKPREKTAKSPEKTKEENLKQSDSNKNSKSGDDKRVKSSGFGKIRPCYERDDLWDGRLDQVTHDFQYNKANPIYRRYEKDKLAREQYIKFLIARELIKRGVLQKPSMSISDAFEWQAELLEQLRNVTL